MSMELVRSLHWSAKSRPGLCIPHHGLASSRYLTVSSPISPLNALGSCLNQHRYSQRSYVRRSSTQLWKLRYFGRRTRSHSLVGAGCSDSTQNVRANALHGRKEGEDEVNDTSWHSLPPATEEILQYLGLNAEGEPQAAREYGGDQTDHGLNPPYKAGLQVQEGYVGLFVRSLGLDNPVQDREEAVLALWRHSKRGKESIDEIVAFPGCLNLVVSLLPSDRLETAEAACGLLRSISTVSTYRSLVVDAGAVEEIAGLLTRRTISPEVREQAMCVLWNISVDEKERTKIADLELLPVLMAMVDSEREGEREAAAGVLANLSLSPSNHPVLIEAGLIPKLAKLLLKDKGMSKVTRQEARCALLELAKSPDQNLAIIEEGLVPVPLIGAGAYRSFKPLLEVAPSLPDDIRLGEAPSPVKSVFGAGELLLGLNVGSDAHDIDDSTRLTLEGRVKQQFLARIGVIEKEVRKYNAEHVESASLPSVEEERITFMPWWDGIPRLVLILSLEDLTVARRAAESMAQIAIHEDHRQAIHKAGAVPHLVRLLGCGDEATTEAAALALDKLGVRSSQKVRRSIDAHGAIPALVAILRASNVPQTTKEKVVSALLRLSHQEEETVAKMQAGAIPGLVAIVDSNTASMATKEEAEEILEELSALKPDPRGKIVAANGLPPLIEMLATGTPVQAEKAACVLENISTIEANARAVVAAGVEASILAKLDVNLEKDDPTKEDTWAVIIAVSRLLEKLVRYEKVGSSLGCARLASVLSKVLEAPTSPLYVKDWVCPCLLRLQRLTKDADILDVSINIEITIHDTIPRLVDEVGKNSSPSVRERAILHLRDLVAQGVAAYSAAISNAGGIFPLVDLLETGSSQARSAAVAVLYNLGMNEENHPAILAAGAVPALQKFVKRGLPEWKIALYLLRALPT